MPGERDDARLFVDAWDEFKTTTAGTVAPEATYQAWLAMIAMKRFGMLRVVQEVDFGTRYLGRHTVLFPGHSLMLDVMVLRQEVQSKRGVYLPRRSALGPRSTEFEEASLRSGLGRLGDFSVISELKVGSSQTNGMTYATVVQDFQKLAAILERAKEIFPDNPLPTAFVGVFDNHPKRHFNFDLLRSKLDTAGISSDMIHLLQ